MLRTLDETAGTAIGVGVGSDAARRITAARDVGEDVDAVGAGGAETRGCGEEGAPAARVCALSVVEVAHDVSAQHAASSTAPPQAARRRRWQAIIDVVMHRVD